MSAVKEPKLLLIPVVRATPAIPSFVVPSHVSLAHLQQNEHMGSGVAWLRSVPFLPY